MSVVWLHGPVGAGKSTLARSLRALVHPVAAVAMLDEDEVRQAVGDADLSGFESDGAPPLAYLAGLARVLAHQGLVVVVAASVADDSALAWNRANLPGYREVFLQASPETVRRRARHRRSTETFGLTISSPVGPAMARPAILGSITLPLQDPDLTIDMDNPEPPELMAFRVAVLIPEFVVAAAGVAGLDARRLRRGA